MRGMPMLSAGRHSVAPGTIAAIVTAYEMRERPALRPEAPDPRWRLARLGTDPAAYRRLYRAVSEDWLWSSRLRLSDPELAAILGSPEVEAYALDDGAGDAALLELDFRQSGACELAFLGLSRGLIGGRAGRWLMNRAIERAWSRPIDRFWLHTCTLDHPAAPAFYARSGFRPFRREVEILEDPRLTGLVRAEAAPHVPLLLQDEMSGVTA